MALLNIPCFDEKEFFDNKINDSLRVVIIPNVSKEYFDKYSELLEKNGFVKKEKVSSDIRRYAAYHCEECGVFLSYFYNTHELQIVTEENTTYFSYKDNEMEVSVTPQITQLHLESFGMSYVIRLSDGRFIVIDGGNGFIPDAERLFNALKEGSPYEKPVIAAWIMSHPHNDHYYCFFEFYKQYKEEVKIEKFLFNFPKADDFEHYPKLECPNLPKGINDFLECVKDSGAEVYTPHTGQTYKIGDAVCEILASMDDTIHCTQNINATSLIIRMELGGQVTLWTTDASFSDARLPERYGSYLKSDILQVPHHGFRSGTSEALIEGYDLIRPQVCILPVSKYNAYLDFCSFRACTGHLMTDLDVAEMITGEETRVLDLPYTPIPYGAKVLEKRYRTCKSCAGAYSWVFTELNTAHKGDFVFTVLNNTFVKSNISIEITFDNKVKRIRHIKTIAPQVAIMKLCIIDPNQVESEAFPYYSDSLKKKGIPKRAPFAVRFLSDVPIVVSHKKHKPAYYSTEIY